MRTIYALTSAILAVASIAMGDTTVTTDPVGYVTGTCLANSDTIVSVPLANAPEFVGTISGTATVVSDAATIVASTSPGWTANQFAALYTSTPSYPTYYIKFKSGTLNGRYFTVTANDTGSITFDTNGDDVTGAVAGDSFAVIKYWTLGTLFPVATQTTFVQSAGTLLLQRKSILLIPDLVSSGISLAPNQKFFLTSAGWKKDASGTPDATNQILYPDTYFIVRHPASVTTNTTYTFTGSVNTDHSVTALTTHTTVKQDNSIAIQRPVGVTLANSGLSSGFVASSGLLVLQRRDVLLVFDNTQVALNKAPKRKFFMVGSSWYEDASGNPNADSFVLDSSSGFIVRKYQTADGSTASFANDPNY